MPNGWKDVRLEDVAEITMGQSPKSETYNIEGDGLPFYQGVTEFTEKFVIKKVYTTKPNKIVEKNAILFSVRAPVGRVNFTKWKSCIGRGNAGIFAKNKEQNFLYFLLKYLEKSIKLNATGTIFTSINGNELKNMFVSYPPLPEQRAIAEVLSAADECIERTQEVIDATERLKKGLMQNLLKKKKGWKEVRLGDVALLSRKSEDTKENMLYVTTSNMLKNAGGIDLSKKPNIPKKANRFYDGDILLSNIGVYLRKIYLSKIDGYCSSDVLVFRPVKDRAVSDFLYHFITSDKFMSTISISSKGTTIPRGDKNAMMNFKLHIPPLPEQRRIADILSSVDEKIALTREKKEKLDILKRGLMQDLLSGNKRILV